MTTTPDAAAVVPLLLRVWRQEPGGQGGLKDYVVAVPPEGMVVDALFALQRQADPSCAFRVSCRAGICGSCAIRVDGRERLACQTPLSLVRDGVRIEPLRHLPVIRDLIVDLTPFFAKYGEVHPEFRPQPLAEPARITAAERGLVERAINCISCGACYSACDIVGLNPAFLGPASLARAFALAADARDADPGARMDEAAGAGGVWRCHNLGNCTVVCPKKVAPLLAIQALRRKAWRTRRPRRSARAVPAVPGTATHTGPPEAVPAAPGTATHTGPPETAPGEAAPPEAVPGEAAPGEAGAPWTN